MHRCLMGQQQAHITVLISITILTMLGGPCLLAIYLPGLKSPRARGRI